MTILQTATIQETGFQLFPSVIDHYQCTEMLRQLNLAMQGDKDEVSVRASRGTVFAARNMIGLCPVVTEFWRYPVLTDLLRVILGEQIGLVRVLYFDKPSDRSWSLPFHKDMTIAVKDNSLPSKHFSKPTRKAGVEHVEASEELLGNMLTLRIHLDEVTDQNGPLQIIPGSHLNGKTSHSSQSNPVKILCQAGDVLAMRPLVSHGSAHSVPGTKLHRRILHFEFSGQENLPDGYRWHTFRKFTLS